MYISLNANNTNLQSYILYISTYKKSRYIKDILQARKS